MAFRSTLSREEVLRIRDKVRAESREVERLFHLPDRWLGEELLRLARQARRERPDRLGNPNSGTYTPDLVWHVVPEVARRLGATRLLPNESTRQDIRAASDAELRVIVGAFLNNSGLDRYGTELRSDAPTACEILGHGIPNGNPVAIAVDRLAPAPGADRDDWIARHVREISRARGLEETARWTPAMQDYPRARPCLLEGLLASALPEEPSECPDRERAGTAENVAAEEDEEASVVPLFGGR